MPNNPIFKGRDPWRMTKAELIEALQIACDQSDMWEKRQKAMESQVQHLNNEIRAYEKVLFCQGRDVIVKLSHDPAINGSALLSRAGLI